MFQQLSKNKQIDEVRIDVTGGKSDTHGDTLGIPNDYNKIIIRSINSLICLHFDQSATASTITIGKERLRHVRKQFYWLFGASVNKKYKYHF